MNNAHHVEEVMGAASAGGRRGEQSQSARLQAVRASKPSNASVHQPLAKARPPMSAGSRDGESVNRSHAPERPPPDKEAQREERRARRTRTVDGSMRQTFEFMEELGVDASEVSMIGVESEVARGVWSCCRVGSRNQHGCKTELGHNTTLPRCEACGQLFDLDSGRHEGYKGDKSEACVVHPGVLQEFRFGGNVWTCCGSSGYEGSLLDQKSETGEHRWGCKKQAHVAAQAPVAETRCVSPVCVQHACVCRACRSAVAHDMHRRNQDLSAFCPTGGGRRRDPGTQGPPGTGIGKRPRSNGPPV